MRSLTGVSHVSKGSVLLYLESRQLVILHPFGRDGERRTQEHLDINYSPYKSKIGSGSHWLAILTMANKHR